MKPSPDNATYEIYLEALRQMREEDRRYSWCDDSYGKNFPQSGPHHLGNAEWGYWAVTPTAGPRRDWSRQR